MGVSRSATGERSAESGRRLLRRRGARLSPAQALFRRLFVFNGLVFTVGTLVLALSPATVSSPVLLTEVPVLIVGLGVILAVNAFLLRASLAPLEALTTLMRRVDLLGSSGRLTDSGNGDLTDVIDTFNAMLDRLEAERSTSTAHVLAAQEGERQRIAQELHDEIGQTLTVALLELKRVVDRAPQELREELHAVQETVRSSLDEVRQVARRLRPGVLEDLGLLSALSALAAEFSRASGVPVERRCDPDLPELSSEAELVIYRIAQESLTNVTRHAKASRVWLSLRAERDTVRLRITDDGCGGVVDEGAGIRGMRERALLIGARLSIDSPPGEGTQVLLEVPLAGRTAERGR
ncbi:two-component system, NarL family, sensor histidine kinase UhpB [Thermostaphylospora chromogena]|uniref:histidine kinase n=1 Tax=Thermostaphylospora chromogena TaxID=35622 RepID=A0A1H1H4B4_9ACTN|nr:sensor histidine kinase [Thermostaphylospora chromogena]SDR19916.1 two-component system, NarL family, sensor histidine kinase UhpB [Thermostaphylospora chromogena]